MKKSIWILFLFALSSTLLAPEKSKPSNPIKTHQLHAYLFGHYQQKKQNFPQAQQWFKNVFNEPVSPAAYKGYLQFLFSTQNHKQVAKLMPTLQETFKNDELVQLLFAQSLARVGNAKEAGDKFIELSQRFKTNQAIVFQAAQTYMRRKELKNALNVIDSYLNNAVRRPNNFMFHFVKSQIYLLLQDKEHALASVKHSIDMFPAFDKGWLLFGILSQQKNDLENAIKGLSTFLELTGNSNKQIQNMLLQLVFKQKMQQNGNTSIVVNYSCFSQAMQLFNQKQFKQALTKTSECLKQKPNHTQGKLLKVQILAALNEHQKLATTLKNWMLADPNNGIWYQTAHLLAKNNGFPKAMLMQLYHTVEAKHPESPLPLFYLADYYIKTGKTSHALNYLRKSYHVAHNPDLQTKIAYQMGIMYYEQHHYKKAKQILLQAEKLGTNFPPLLNLLAYYFASKEHNLPEAEKRIALVMKEDPHNPHFKDTQAVIWYKQGKEKQALALLQEIAQEISDDALIMRHLAKVQKRCGKLDAACNSLKLACNMNCSPHELKKNRNLLHQWIKQKK